MKVISKYSGGYRQDGTVLLQEGENILAEPLTPHERDFINAMIEGGFVTVIEEEVPGAPISETRMATSSRLDVAVARPMKVRRAKRKGR